MNTKELRIGSIIRYKYGEDEYNTVTSISEEVVTIDTITWDYLGFDDIEGIPLTAELLERMGFEKNVKHYVSVVYEKTTYECDFSLERWEDEYEWFMVNEQTNLGIKHVHQLQNLYFALCGKELEIGTE